MRNSNEKILMERALFFLCCLWDAEILLFASPFCLFKNSTQPLTFSGCLSYVNFISSVETLHIINIESTWRGFYIMNASDTMAARLKWID